MTPKRLKYPLVRVLGTTAFASLALLAACEAKLPTSDDIDHMTASTATAAAGPVVMLDTANVAYYVNNVRVSKAEADKVAAERIATVNVSQKGLQSGGEVRLTVRDSSLGDALTPTRIRYKRMDANATGPTEKQAAESKPRTPFTGLVIIDGVVSDMNAMARIAPEQIASVDVIKGASATSQYSDPRAANGVIVVHTKGAKQ